MPETFRLPRCALPRHYDLHVDPDLEAGRFEGRVAIDLDVVDATELLVLNAAELELGEVTVRTPSGRSLGTDVSIDEHAQQVTVRLAEVARPAQGYRLVIPFAASLDGKLRGFYRARFDGGVVAATQFEPTDARRAFPCFDEPDLKATFSVALTVPEGLVAISNEAAVSTEALPDGRYRIEFAETIPMSTYLLAWVIGAFESTEPQVVDGVPVRILAPKGKLHLAHYATGAATHALGFLAKWFDLPYPGGKIDHVAVPEFAFGAMENLGCVTYRDNALLADESSASQTELQRIATVVAHETAHMWFGDLVTMRWWDGIWLNEAFATYMELTCTESFNPAWKPWASFGAGKAAALATDGLQASRPVEFDVAGPEEAQAMFDVLTYQKGGSVLRMIERHIGLDAFRAGVSDYLRTHANANTDSSDLWAALEAASDQPVGAIAGSWFRKPGHPIVSVEPVDDGIVLRQERFLYRGQAEGDTWAVPVAVRASVDGSIVHRKVLLDGRTARLQFDEPIDWVVANDGAWGFYRVSYRGGLREKLESAGLQEVCDPLERMAIIVDLWAEVVSGRADLYEWAHLIASLDADIDPDVWSAVAGGVDLLDRLAADGSDRDALQRFVRKATGPAWQRLGWEARSDEPKRDRIARGRLLGLVGLAGADPDVQAECASRFRRSALTSDLAAAAAKVFVASGGEDAWSSVLDAYRSAPTPQERLRYLTALPCSPEPLLLARTLDLTIGDDVRMQEAPFVIAGVMAGRAGGRLAWEWVERHWDELSRRFPPNLLEHAVDALTALLEPELAESVHSFVSDHQMPMAGHRIAQLLERMDINVALGQRLRGSLADALDV